MKLLRSAVFLRRLSARWKVALSTTPVCPCNEGVMTLLKPTYRLSRLKFCLYTLAYYVFVVVVGFIISATGGSGGWIGLLMGLVLFFIYLQYIVRPRLRNMGHSQWWALTLFIPLLNLCAMVALLVLPGNQAANRASANGIRKIAAIGVGLLAAPVILGGGLATAYAFAMAISTCFAGAWGCSESRSEAAVVAERETMITAIMVMMVDNDLSQVTASTSGHGGEKIDATSNQFHPTLNLQDYLAQATTQFCYRWQNDGWITFQYDVDDNDNCAIDAEQLFP